MVRDLVNAGHSRHDNPGVTDSRSIIAAVGRALPRMGDLLVGVAVRCYLFLLKLSRYPRHPLLGLIIGRVFLHGQKKRVLRNMHTVLPTTTLSTRKKWTGFCTYVGTTLLEIDWMVTRSKITLSKHFIVQGEDHLQEALSTDKGVLLLFSHFGNMASFGDLALLGYDLGVVARPLAPRSLNVSYEKKFNFFRTTRIDPGPSMLVHGWNKLRRNGIFAVAVDFSANGPYSEWIDFGHSQLLVNLSPILLAIRTKSPILYAFVDRTDDLRYQITIVPVGYSVVEGYDRETATAVAAMTLSMLYAQLKKCPTNWWLWADCLVRPMESRQTIDAGIQEHADAT